MWIQLTEVPNMWTGNTEQNFPGSSVVKNLPANAGDMGLNPGSRTEISKGNQAHEPQLLTPTCLEPMLRREKRGHLNKKPAHCGEK